MHPRRCSAVAVAVAAVAALALVVSAAAQTAIDAGAPAASASVTTADVLDAWMQRNGARQGNVALRMLPDGSYGMVATNDIEAGELLLSVPLALVLSPNAVASRKLLEPLEEHLHPVTVLALGLIRLRFNESNPWRPYFETLPRTYGTSLYFSDAELAELKGTALYDATNARLRAFADEFEAVRAANDRLAVPFAADQLTFENFKWALSTVLAFGLPVETAESGGSTSYVLVPKWHYFGHNNVRTEVKYNAASGALEIYTLRAWKQGEQVFVSYGNLANDELLLTHGVLIEGNEHDNFHIVLGGNRRMPLRGDNDKLNPAVLAALRQFHFADDTGASATDLQGKDFTRFQSLDNEFGALRSLLRVVDQQLQNYATDETHDKDLLARSDISDRLRAAAYIRYSERKLLTSVRAQLVQMWTDLLVNGTPDTTADATATDRAAAAQQSTVRVVGGTPAQ